MPRIAPALASPVGVPLRTVLEGLVPVSDITEEVDLILVCEESSSDAVDGGITPSFVVKATLVVEEFKELRVRLVAPEVEIANLEVRPD